MAYNLPTFVARIIICVCVQIMVGAYVYEGKCRLGETV